MKSSQKSRADARSPIPPSLCPHFLGVTLLPLQMMEEYDWGEFAVVTSLLPGYDTFVDIVETYTDTSYFLWNVQDILSLEMSVGASEAKTKRLLQQVPANPNLIFFQKVARKPCSNEAVQEYFEDFSHLFPIFSWTLRSCWPTVPTTRRSSCSARRPRWA